jgi:hypothetical protein
MKKLVGALLLAAPLAVTAATENPDGSVTLSAEESRATMENLSTLLAERQQMVLIIRQLMEQIENTGTSGSNGPSGTSASSLQCT